MSLSRTRREFIRVLGLGAGAALLSRCAPAPRRPQRPNIVLLLTDDQRWDAMGCAGNPVIQTPNMDELAAEGMRFRNAFVTTSICPVSRASILTGQYMRRHRIKDFSTQLSITAMVETYPLLLRPTGYYTGFIGKWGVGASRAGADAASWAFDYWAGASGQGNYWHEATCPYVTNDGVIRNGKNVCTCPPNGPWPRTGNRMMKNPKHLTTEITPAKFVQFLDSRDPERPFCLSISFKAAHVPWDDSDPRLRDLYAEQTMPVPRTATPDDYARQPEFLRESRSGKAGTNLTTNHETVRNRLRKYYRLITGVDIAIGEIRRALAQGNLAENTVIIFSSDNGYLMGEHGLSSKWLMHEESIRVPMLIADPRLPTGTRDRITEEMALNIDIAPTILDLAGVVAPARMQGRSLLPLLSEPGLAFREDWFYEHHFEEKRIESTEGVRGRQRKYIRYINQEPPYEQLFDLEADPLETRNLATIASHGATLQHMRSRWRFHRKSLR